MTSVPPSPLDADAHGDVQRFVAEAARIVSESLDLQQTVERVAQLPIPRLADWCFVDLLRDEDSFERVAVGHAPDDARRVIAQQLTRRYSLHTPKPTGTVVAMREQRTLVMGDVSQSELAAIAQDADHASAAEAVNPRAAVIAPMLVRQRSIGALALLRTHRNFSADEVWIVEQLAGSAAAAIENARLFEAERRAHVRVIKLQEVTAALSRASTAAEVANVACRIGTEAMQAHSGALWLLDSHGSLVLAGSWGTPAEFIQQFRVIPRKAAGSPALAVVHSGEPMWIETAEDYGRFAPAYYEQAESAGRLSSFGVVPLRLGGQAEGVIVFAHPIGHRYDDAARAFYLTLAQHCSQALERARLLDSERRSNARLELLARASEALVSSLRIEDTLRAVAEVVVPEFGDWCSVDLVEGGDMRRLASAGSEPLTLRERGVTGSVVAERSSRLVGSSSHPELTGSVSAIAVPLQAHGDCIGALTLAMSAPEREYNAQDLAMAEELARRIGSALVNARMHRELEEAHARMRHLLHEAPLSIAIYRGAEHRLEFANPAHLSGTGRSADATGKLHTDLFPDAPTVRRLLTEVFATGLARTLPELGVRVNRADAPEQMYFHVSLVPLRNESGAVDSVMSIALDITERVRARKELELARQSLAQAEERLRLALAAAKMGAFDFDPRSDALVWDARCREMCGVDIDVPLEREVALELVHPDDRGHVLEALGRAANPRGTGELFVEFRVNRASDGEVRWLSARGRVHLDAGRAVRLVGTLLDNTELKAIQAARDQLLESERAARAEAELANRVKDDFLAIVSHELRTPLNAILGWASIVSSKTSDPAFVAKGVEVIHRNARTQARIIEDMLDVSRIIAGKLKLEMREVDFANIVRDAIEVVRPSADQKRLTLTFVTVGEPAKLSGDPDRLQQVVWNLLSNAVKFTDAGGRVDVRFENHGPLVALYVRDTGCGITSEFLPRIFERFRQADSSAARKFGGLGLGLTIVRHLVELHGGRVSATSAGLGLGSEFRVELPTFHAAADPGDTRRSSKFPVAREVLAGLEVLLVEDDADTRDFLKTSLEMEGNVVLAVGSADEAIDALNHARFDVLLSDIGMPGRDGYDLIRSVRARSDEARGVLAIALTAYVRDVDRLAALNAGFDAHLPKPLDLARLAATIHGLLDKPSNEDQPRPGK